MDVVFGFLQIQMSLGENKNRRRFLIVFVLKNKNKLKKQVFWMDPPNFLIILTSALF